MLKVWRYRSAVLKGSDVLTVGVGSESKAICSMELVCRVWRTRATLMLDGSAARSHESVARQLSINLSAPHR